MGPSGRPPPLLGNWHAPEAGRGWEGCVTAHARSPPDLVPQQLNGEHFRATWESLRPEQHPHPRHAPDHASHGERGEHQLPAAQEGTQPHRSCGERRLGSGPPRQAFQPRMSEKDKAAQRPRKAKRDIF